MKKMKRLLAVILASLLILSSATAAASAYKYDSYKDEKLTQYDFTDSAVLTTEQYASMLLDYADEALAKENITMDLSILGKLDATSIDNALSSGYKIIDSNGAILNLAGDLKHVKVSAIKDARRSNGTDVAVINSLLQFLADNNSIIKKVVLGGIGKQRRRRQPWCCQLVRQGRSEYRSHAQRASLGSCVSEYGIQQQHDCRYDASDHHSECSRRRTDNSRKRQESR